MANGDSHHEKKNSTLRSTPRKENISLSEGQTFTIYFTKKIGTKTPLPTKVRKERSIPSQNLTLTLLMELMHPIMLLGNRNGKR